MYVWFKWDYGGKEVETSLYSVLCVPCGSDDSRDSTWLRLLSVAMYAFPAMMTCMCSEHGRSKPVEGAASSSHNCNPT
ncbi:hypothetical protein BJX99DRAFT_240213 [Aspergillus californicus]